MSISDPVKLIDIDSTMTDFNMDTVVDLKQYVNSTNQNANLASKRTKVDKITVEELKLRNYQLELSAEALNGKNCIICAPTGSGKTIVATFIIREHLRQRLNQEKLARVVVLVPTVNLIDQQEKLFSQYLSNEFTIGGLKGGQTGTSKVPKAMLLLRLNIAVMTPQIFLNMISSNGSLDNNDSATTDQNEQMTVDLGDVTMMIFDECHHCDKSHAYNDLMSIYFAKKHQGSTAIPQIVGLTASLGVGQADTEALAVDHVIKICANLDTAKLCAVEKNIVELDEHVYSPEDCIETVRCPHDEHPLSNSIIAIMKVLEGKMKPIFEYMLASGVKKVKDLTTTPPEKRWSDNYTCWMFQWFHFAPRLQDSDMKRRFITLLEHAIVYHKSLEINALTPTSFAVKYLREEFDKKEKRAKTELDKELIELYTTQKANFDLIALNDSEKPIVAKLKAILLNEYRENLDCRSLIFVRTRELAVAVKNFVNKDPKMEFLNANFLTGVNSRKDQGGMTLNEQEDCVAKFRNGTHKVLVATTVAEEGLDISKCNLVVKYNHVTNEIALVQRRGRGRAFGSKSILLTHEGWIERKEMVNLLRERLMKMAIKIIKAESDDWFIGQIDKRIQEMKEEKEIEKSLQEKKRLLLGNREFNLLCKKCDHLITSSKNICLVQQSHFISIDPEIWHRIKMMPRNPMQLFAELSIAGFLMCSECNNLWGNVIKYCQVYLPTLKPDAFVIYDPKTNQKETVRKWKEALQKYFVVDMVKRKDLIPMHNALKSEIRDMMDAALAVQEARQNANKAKEDESENVETENVEAALAFIETTDEALEQESGNLIHF